MEQDRPDSFASPLDEVLKNLPHEDPPADLQQRCLDALDEAAGQTRVAHPRWWAPVRNVVAVAAGLLLIVGTANLFQAGRMAQGRARMTSALSDEKQLEVAAPADRVAAEMPGEPQAAPRAPAPEPLPAPAAPAARDEAARRVQLAGDELGRERRSLPDEYAEQAEGDMVMAQAAPAEQRVEDEAALGMMDVVAPRTPAVSAGTERRTPTVEDPWRDLSGERQVITQKEMEIEVAEVERAYDEARSIVEKHGGFVASDRVTISEDQADSAHLTIRLPVASFESAITDLRQLGKVVRLVGQSVDVTEDYYTEGAQVREMADREQWLIDRLENARTEAQRRQLRQQINALREEMRREKEILTNLAEQTHWPVLELVLTESTGPGGFFARMLSGSLTALAWVGATAIIWVPIVVLLTLFWRRIVPASPSSE
ncbi:MAG: DUF4349 domain-containing protein [Armatimonadota bacterium]